jgi:uncharacterized membrane protein
MQAVWGILALWLAFAASHMGLSSLRLRPRLAGALGERGFAGIYSLVALAIFVPLVWLYFDHRHAGAHLWYLGPGPAVRAVMYVGMATAFSLIVGGLFQQSPAALGGGRAEVRGVLHVTRHPVFMGAGLFGLVHLLGANVNAAELVFFAGFPIFAVLGCAHQDRRKRVSLGEPYARFCAETSLLPFGRGGLRAALREAWLPIAIGVAASVALRSVHPQWLGGAP